MSKKKYLDGRINSHLFRVEFPMMVSQDLKEAYQMLTDFEQLSTFWIDSELEVKEFCSLFEEINDLCLYRLDFEYEYPQPEEEFRDSIEKLFSQIQNK